MTKYFKPKSLTWWTGFIALLTGVIVAIGSEVQVLAPTANVLKAMTDISPAAMISFGLGIIGLRGKDG